MNTWKIRLFSCCSDSGSARRSVYLHNNKLSDAGLPEHMFNGSDSLEILTMSSNFLQVVPSGLPSTLYRLHLKVPAPTVQPKALFLSVFPPLISFLMLPAEQ